MKRKFPTKLLALLACLMCSTTAIAQEAYAVFTPEDSTLTFYYDTQRDSRPGATYGIHNEEYDFPEWIEDSTMCPSILVTHAVFDPSFAGARPQTTYGWFLCMFYLESISGLEYLNTSEVTNMGLMF